MAVENSVLKANSLGQSFWLDSLSREIIKTKKLDDLIKRGVSGLTSNPTIFEKALLGNEYKEPLKRLIDSGFSLKDALWSLMIEDIQMAADLFLDTYKSSNGVDGYVSIEVDPALANDTKKTILSAKELSSKINRPNVMIKVPGTKEGVVAVEELIYLGLNVNITLLFSVKAYKEAAQAYIKGLTRRLKEKKSVSNIASVASFFVSRVDTEVDGRLSQTSNLLGQAALNNAKLAYGLFTDLFLESGSNSANFLSLKKEGALVQRPLWASTSTKNPSYPKTKYIGSLVGKHTVNTMPEATFELAINDEGDYVDALKGQSQAAKEEIKKLANFGVDIDEVTDKLLEDGLSAFQKSFLGLFKNAEKLIA